MCLKCKNHCVKIEDRSWWFYTHNQWIRQAFPGLHGLVSRILTIAQKHCVGVEAPRLCQIYSDMLCEGLLLPMIGPFISINPPIKDGLPS